MNLPDGFDLILVEVDRDTDPNLPPPPDAVGRRLLTGQDGLLTELSPAGWSLLDHQLILGPEEAAPDQRTFRVYVLYDHTRWWDSLENHEPTVPWSFLHDQWMYGRPRMTLEEVLEWNDFGRYAEEDEGDDN